MTKVGCLFGGESPEYEVSIVSAENVCSKLSEAGYEVIPIGIDPQGKWHVGEGAFSALKAFNGSELEKAALTNRFILDQLDLDVLFPVIHGRNGEDGAVQGFCELLGLPYVGGGVLNQSLCMDKISAKRLLCERGFPQPAWREVTGNPTPAFLEKQAKELEADLGYPLFVKPSRAGSSIGITKAKNRMDLEVALGLAFQFDTRVIVETAILNPVEVEIAALGGTDPFLSVPGEVLPQREYYDFQDKYLDGATQFVVPASIPESMLNDLNDQARQAWSLFDCFGMARIDFLCSGSTVYLSEINTIPGFTNISMYPSLLEASGVDQLELMNRLVDLAIERHRNQPKKHRFNSQSDWYRKT